MTEFEFLDIMHRAEMLKNNTRHSWTSQDRHESVAEHSWRLAFMVLMYSYELKKEFPKVDIDKVLRMCIIHDLGEAFTGDIPSFYKTDADSVKESDILLDWFRSMPAPFDTELPALWEEMEALETTEARIYKAFGVDLPAQVIDELMAQAYGDNFDDERICPITSLDADTHVLALWPGPTSAFKDVALSVLPRLVSAAAKQEGAGDVVILTATSGDTGKAALEGFHDVPGTRIMVFYPAGGVSPVQEAQMVTQEGGNVRVCAIRGNFDDAQTGVKNVFAACKGKGLHGAVLSSANSINIGRLAPQVVYYFRAYADLVQAGRIRVGEKVHFVVPTGNFGDILAGYFAKRMGLPVGRLVCASNANDVLTEFISTGVYDRRRPFYKTTSPSMDILVSSNLERLLYLLSEGDCGYVAGLMEQLNREGHYQVSPRLLERLQAEFDCACCDDAGAAEVIRRLWQEQHYLCDPHTAVAWSAAEQVRLEDGAPVVVLSTASPYKFPAAVLGALEGGCDGDEFAMMERLHRLTGTEVPRNLAGLQGRTVRHRDVIDKEQMLDYVLAEVMRS